MLLDSSVFIRARSVRVQKNLAATGVSVVWRSPLPLELKFNLLRTL